MSKEKTFKKRNITKKYYNLVKHDMYTYDLKELSIDPDGNVEERSIGTPDIYQHLINRLNNMVEENHIEAYEYGRKRKGTEIKVT